MHKIFLADTLAPASAGNSMDASIAMIATTTKSSINVNALFDFFIVTNNKITGEYPEVEFSYIQYQRQEIASFLSLKIDWYRQV